MKICLMTLACATAVLAQILPPSDQSPIKPDTVVATVDGHDVTAEEFQAMLQNAPPSFVQGTRGRPDQFLQVMFLTKFLAEDGDKLKLGEKSPLKEQIEFNREYAIANQRVSYEQDSYNVSDKEINDFYDANRERWTAAKIKVILLGFKPDIAAGTSPDDVKRAAEQAFGAAHALNDRSQAEATKLAADIVQQLRAGADFGKLVEQYSDDKESKAEGGDFGIAIKSTSTSFSDVLKKAVFALKPSEISDPVPQPGGFYIIRLEEKTVQPLKEVNEPITQEIKGNHRNAWITGLNGRFMPKLLRPDFFVGPGAPK
jgi:peptidyl-prolyl cis-trans isomerase C